MVVGVARVRLHIPQSGSLKEKRSVLNRILARVRNEHTVSIAEVAEHDVWTTATLGMCTVGHDPVTVREALNQAIRSIERIYLAPLLNQEIETLNFKDSELLNREPL